MVTGSEPTTSYNVDTDRKFKEWLERARAESSDLSEPLRRISFDFFRSEGAIFNLKGPGQYPIFKNSTASMKTNPNGTQKFLGTTNESRYQKWKKRKYGFDYPLLKATGKLAKSLTDPADANAIALITNKTDLIIGTRVEYGIFHQSDKPRDTIPLRKFLFIGPESIQFTNSPDIAGRTGRWLNILNDHILMKLGAPR
jgi:phage gpG-like protein